MSSLPSDFRQAERDAGEARDLAADAAMKAYADEELKSARAAMERLEGELQKALLPKDPNDERNIFLEVRAGTGGDESALFAGDLFRMYTRYAERQGWQVEIISESPSELGGYKEVIARIVGQGAYSQAQVRVGRPSRAARARDRGAGAHPHLGLHGRRAARGRRGRRRGAQPGGAAHRHLPRLGRRRPARQQDRLGDPRHAPAHRHRGRVPGLALAAQEPREGARACSRRASRTSRLREQQAKTASTRKSLIGSGDRSERIRTYNFPQGRVTDHRINLTLYKIDRIMDGELDELIGALAAEHQAEQLAALAEETA